jgi:hypothetical protein
MTRSAAARSGARVAAPGGPQKVRQMLADGLRAYNQTAIVRSIP